MIRYPMVKPMGFLRMVMNGKENIDKNGLILMGICKYIYKLHEYYG